MLSTIRVFVLRRARRQMVVIIIIVITVVIVWAELFVILHLNSSIPKTWEEKVVIQSITT